MTVQQGVKGRIEPAIQSRARRCGNWRPLPAASGAYAPSLQVVRRSPVASCASCDGLRSGPGDLEPSTVVRQLAAVPAASGLAPLATRAAPIPCSELSKLRWAAQRPRRFQTEHGGAPVGGPAGRVGARAPRYTGCADPL